MDDVFILYKFALHYFFCLSNRIMRNLITLLLFLVALMMPTVAVASVNADVNGDGEVTVADVNEVINSMLGSTGNIAADVNGDGEITIADINAIIDFILNPYEEHEYVDLGLPSGTLWATMNVGAISSIEYGDRFAWGETAPKSEYNWSNYKWCEGTESTLTKYCLSNSSGTVDRKTELDPEDDAAYVNWGPSWRMPTVEQQRELVNKCTWTWTKWKGVNGCLFTGPNGNTIFLPAYGDSQYASGFYWSRTLGPNYSRNACIIYFFSQDTYTIHDYRCVGHPVRAVRASHN